MYDWHLRPRMLERCIPPFEKMEVICSRGRPDQIGSKFILRSKVFNLFWSKHTLEFTKTVKNEFFSLHQLEGFFEQYDYSTTITEQETHTSEIIDRFEFSHNFPSFLSPFVSSHLKKRIGKILAYKHELIDFDIGMIQKYPFKKPYRVLISGSHGMIGRNIAYFLDFMGHEVWYLSRKQSDEENTVTWDPRTGECNPSDFEGFDVVINLAGENIGRGWWTKKKKKRVLESRTQGTQKLVDIIKGLKKPPKVFISASAVGYYGSRGREILTESAGPGRGLFISEVCEKWERVGRDLEEMGIRVACTRFGTVLSSEGGALKQMLPPFKWGLGGRFGDGQQYVSWIAIDDVVGALYHTMMTPKLHGAINVVSPNPVPNDLLAKKLAKRLNRWLGPPIPECLIRILLGQKGEELLLTSARVEPQLLIESGYSFHYPRLCQTLEHVV
ncbi:MAG: TIGR01777 family oxidoreductase [Chlamydiia bacterium]|nr:TIGR01777 family oxidoreductase [Chlamydiia bacterium]